MESVSSKEHENGLFESLILWDFETLKLSAYPGPRPNVGSQKVVIFYMIVSVRVEPECRSDQWDR